MPARSVACDECKRRKVRCSAERMCGNCQRDRKTCTYSPPPHRVAALQETIQKYVTLLERISKVWDDFIPDIALDRVLAGGASNVNAEYSVPSRPPQTPGATRHSNRAPSSNSPTISPTHAGFVALPSDQNAAARSSNQPATRSHAAIHDNTPEQSNAEDYEFDESQNSMNTIDEVSLLTESSQKVGYTGPQSRIAAAKLLHALPVAGHSKRGHDTTSRPIGTFSESAARNASLGSCITKYFTYYHTFYPLLHEGQFRAHLLGAVAKPKDGSWQLLLNMVACMGAFAGGSSDDDDQLAEHFYQIAQGSISLSVIEKGSLAYVQGLCLMAHYLQLTSKPNAGFALIGFAWSMAMAIGLNREFDNGSTTCYTMEQRRRAWWTVFVLVSSAQLTLGRPPASLVGIKLQLPANLDDADLSIDMTEMPAASNDPTVAACLIAQVSLAQIGNAIQTELLTHQVPALSRVEELRTELKTWQAGLPTYFDESVNLPAHFEMPKFILLWRAHHMRIVLDRPFLFRAIADKAGLEQCDGPVWACINAANSCVASICGFVQSRQDWKKGFAAHAIHWLLSASFVHALCFAYSHNSQQREQWRAQIRQATDVLEKLRLVHGMADRAKQVLERVLAFHNHQSLIPTEARHSAAWEHAGEPNLIDFSANYLGLRTSDELTHQTFPIADVTSDVHSLYHDWYMSEFPEAEFLDAAGGITLQNFSEAWQ